VAGTPQERDTKVLELPDNPDWMIGAQVTDDGRCVCYSLHAQPNIFVVMLRFLLLSFSSGYERGNRLWYLDLAALPVDPEGGAVQLEGAADKVGMNEWAQNTFSFHFAPTGTQVVKLVDTVDARFEYIANDGSVFVFRINLGAPRDKLVRVDVASAASDPRQWTTLVPEDPQALMQWAAPLDVQPHV
jgi:prolyl oligopeptidase